MRSSVANNACTNCGGRGFHRWGCSSERPYLMPWAPEDYDRGRGDEVDAAGRVILSCSLCLMRIEPGDYYVFTGQHRLHMACVSREYAAYVAARRVVEGRR